MRTLLAVLLMTCVSVCFASASSQKNSNVIREIVVVKENAATSQNEAIPSQKNVVIKKAPHQTQKTVIVKEVSPRARHQTVIVKEVPPRATHQTIIVKKNVKKRKICKRYRQSGTYHCEEREVPKHVVVKRVYDQDDFEDLTYEEVRPRRGVVVSPAKVYYEAMPIGLNLHFRLP